MTNAIPSISSQNAKELERELSWEIFTILSSTKTLEAILCRILHAFLNVFLNDNPIPKTLGIILGLLNSIADFDKLMGKNQQNEIYWKTFFKKKNVFFHHDLVLQYASTFVKIFCMQHLLSCQTLKNMNYLAARSTG